MSGPLSALYIELDIIQIRYEDHIVLQEYLLALHFLLLIHPSLSSVHLAISGLHFTLYLINIELA